MIRVSNQWMINSFVRTINRTSDALNKTQVQISSGKQYTRPSDEPVKNALAMQHKTEIFEHDQYLTNISRTTEWLDNTDSAMTQMESTLQRARELAVQGANDTLVQDDRDAIAKEIDQLLLHMVELGNTDVGGQYIFAGANVNDRPFQILDGQTPNMMNDVVQYTSGLTRSKLNLASPLDVAYKGNMQSLLTEIEKSVTLKKNVTGASLFYGQKPIIPQPSFKNEIPPLGKNLWLSALNSGRGVQAGAIILTDSNSIDTLVDLKPARNLDDVIGIINATGSFSAGFEEVPSKTAESLGLLRNVGQDNLLIGQSDAAMLSTGTALSDLNGGLGVPGGFLSINTRDGKNHRVDLNGAVKVQDVLDRINALDGGLSVSARYDMIHNRLELTDVTGGKGDFSVESKKNQMFITDIPAHTAADLGLAKDVVAGSSMLMTFDPAVESQATPLSYLNGGKGVEKGYLNVTGHDGTSATVNLTATQTIQDVIDAINVQTGGRQTAVFDIIGKTIQITDNTVGATNFSIQEVNGAAPILVREPTTLTKNLGLLKSSQGNTLIGDSLQPGGFTVASNLSALVPPPQPGFMILRGADDQPVSINLNGAVTIQDALNEINASKKFTASWDVPAQRFIITDTSGTPGDAGIRAEEQTNTAKDLGLLIGSINYQQDTITGAPIPVSSLPTLVGSIDLNPAVTGETTLESLNAGRTWNKGVQLGFIRITDKAGHFIAIDMRGAKTVQDALDKINDSGNGLYIEAKINANRNGIEIVDKNHGAQGKLEIIDVDTSTASDLGISTVPGGVADTRIVGRDIDPALRENIKIKDLRVNEGGVPLSKVYVQSGEKSGEVDLTGVTTVGELLEKLSLSDMNLSMNAWISEDGRRINITNTKNQPFIKIRNLDEQPGNATASSLGLGGSRGIFESLVDLRDNLLRNDTRAISEQSIKNIQEDITRVLKFHTEVGVKTNRATASKEKLENFTFNLKKMLDSVENIDMTEAITQMTTLQTAFQAALQTGSRILQTSLMDFLK